MAFLKKYLRLELKRITLEEDIAFVFDEIIINTKTPFLYG